MPGKAITIDTGGFTLSRTYALSTTTGVLTLTGPYTSGAYTFNGAIVGSNSGPAGTTAGRIGVYLDQQAAMINNGTITGGAGGGVGGAGGDGFALFNSATLTNNGTLSGGNSSVATGGVVLLSQEAPYLPTTAPSRAATAKQVVARVLISARPFCR